MGHLGLTPQSIYKFGTYSVRAKNDEEANKIIDDAKMLEKIAELVKEKKIDSMWTGECFVFDNRVTIKKDAKPGTYGICNACRMPISNKEMKSTKYKIGLSCPKCYDNLTAEQIQLADINNDGIIDILDIVSLVNMILNPISPIWDFESMWTGEDIYIFIHYINYLL